ncbi:MAG: hypothetical protein WBL02_02330 [Methanomethylovorans sp.]|uniref:hypothetical protein n=1 Tax=Methanomethylovorans sp. TaxID=2758717 RepID=UPI003C77EA0C
MLTNIHLSPETASQRIFVCFRRWLFISVCLVLLSHVCAADNTTMPTIINDTGPADISFQQYILDIDMSSAAGIIVQETWTLLPGNSNITNINMIGISVPADSTIMLFQEQDMSDATSITDIEYDQMGNILFFSSNITSASSGRPRLYNLVYLLPQRSGGQFTKMLTVPEYQPALIHSLVLNVKTDQGFDPVLFDGSGMPLSSNSRREGNITTFLFSHPSFDKITVSTVNAKVSKGPMRLSAFFFSIGLLALGSAVYLNKREKDMHKGTDVQELRYRYAAVQKVLSAIDSDLREKIIDENIHNSMLMKYKKEENIIKKELDKEQNK